MVFPLNCCETFAFMKMMTDHSNNFTVHKNATVEVEGHNFIPSSVTIRNSPLKVKIMAEY